MRRYCPFCRQDSDVKESIEGLKVIKDVLDCGCKILTEYTAHGAITKAMDKKGNVKICTFGTWLDC